MRLPNLLTRPDGRHPGAPAAAVWHRDNRVGLALILASVATTLVVGFLGPSVVTLTLGDRTSLLPPYYLPTKWLPEPDELAVSVAVLLGIAVGALGVWICLRAMADGWRPHHRRLFGLGAVMSTATIMVPPLTSADILMYAGYGRLQVLGRNPYDITPAEIFRSQYDPVLALTEEPWRDTPSVYGPITSWTQWFSNVLGGENMHDVVFWLQVFCLVPFLLTCAGVVWLAHGDPKLQSRAALLSICNPLLIWAVVASGHNEAQSVMFAVLGLMLMRKSPFGAGIGIGLAGCAKLSIGLYGLAMLWAYRREPKKALLLCLGALVPIGLAYGVWQPTALLQVLRNTTYVSAGGWASPVYGLLTQVLHIPPPRSTALLNVVALVMLVVVAWMLSRVLPWRAAPGLRPGTDPMSDPITVALRTALLLSVGWLVTSIYTLSWYDLIAWVPLAVIGATQLDRLFLWRGALLSMAFVPGRAVEMGPALDFLAARMRDTASPVVQWGVLVMIVLWWRRMWLLPRRELKKLGVPVQPPRESLLVTPATPTSASSASSASSATERP
ncbi:hypothetical protein DT076_16065 [Desertihabitans brevis]|uniref:DUF2029 domain-containing protein n=1 Tax=Desertihabitans brevis TaxID=2268447 RepID=A0A367YTT2_9ACTN|nr:hypothetical protein [Desertihabitans brevis]RCK68432.1 hypothetical protein DT076_16065 [Desertihabitans brevis]